MGLDVRAGLSAADDVIVPEVSVVCFVAAERVGHRSSSDNRNGNDSGEAEESGADGKRFRGTRIECDGPRQEKHTSRKYTAHRFVNVKNKKQKNKNIHKIMDWVDIISPL